MVKNLPANTELIGNVVLSLGWEDPLENPEFLTGESHGKRSQVGYCP